MVSLHINSLGVCPYSCSPQDLDNDKCTLLMLAAKIGNIELIKLLIQKVTISTFPLTTMTAVRVRHS